MNNRSEERYMSRSRKKTLIIKESNKWAKGQSNKKYRRRSIELSDVKPNRLYDSYNITDYAFLVEDTWKNRMK